MFFKELEFHRITINYLKSGKSESRRKLLDILYLIYIVSMNCFRSISLQSVYKKGFDNFQKIADSGAREGYEKDYYIRYIQLHGPDVFSKNSDLATIEGRFSPKSSIEENEFLIYNILNGFVKYARGKNGLLKKEDLNSLIDNVLKIDRPKLRLVCHFIKGKWNYHNISSIPDMNYHFKNIRENLIEKGKILQETFVKYPKLKDIIVGVDAAANEMDTPPEVFSPLYRFCRRNFIKKFTYHVGEDFEHLMTGIRAIYESIVFLNLKSGDRIGHATAIGLIPSDWIKAIPREVFISKGVWLENLLFARKVAIYLNIDNIQIYKLEYEINKLSKEIFGDDYSKKIDLLLLDSFFEHRYLNPEIVNNFLENKVILDLYEISLVKSIPRDTLCLLRDRWFNVKTFTKYEEKEKVCSDFFSENFLVKCQQYVQKLISEKSIVIESLITSNVRISIYNSIKDHHIFRWLRIANRKIEGDYPMIIVLGSDDPGIFSTDLRNEIYHIFSILKYEFDYSDEKAISVIKMLNNNGFIYHFNNDESPRLNIEEKFENGFLT
ncbi:hypothetical protein L4F91_05050 [Avibacterium sp. 20-126]|uniref:hypothetical protein n=1 Tax=Avibacterium sp. 20-126 TaxID=2911524 RepID=UPI002185E5BA|nr:hypothetical protein L4F91_05050 [Avibacterium sp. 20-126]